MSNRAKAVTLVLAALAPWMGAAQTVPAKPSPQQRAQAAPPAKAPAPPPQPASADSRRFVGNENFYRAGSAAQPTPSAANAAQPQNPASAPVAGVNRINNALPAAQRTAMPPAPQPAVASLPAQPAVPQPVANAPSVPAPADHEMTAAVDYSSGKLTVVADRAPLGHVLKLIAGKTGAVIDLAPELQQEPVMAKLGPSPVREVLTALLDSPRIDYIVMGTGEEPGTLQRIVVRKRQSFGNSPMAPFRSQQPQQQQIPGVDPNGQVISRRAIPGQNEATEEQRMEEWKKQRAQMLEAEMKQAAQERENEKYQPQDPPAPQPVPQPQDNPPQ
jgi:hypothetical protein